MDYRKQMLELSGAAWQLYRIPASSSEFLPGTDLPLEVIMMQSPPDGQEENLTVWILVTGAGGCLRVALSKATVQDDFKELDLELVSQLMDDLYNDQELVSAWPTILSRLQAEDPYALPQRKVPDFLQDGEDQMIQNCPGFGGMIPAKMMRIRDDVEIELSVDVINHPRYPQTFLRVWARWPGMEDFHLVCWQLISTLKDGADSSYLLQQILSSNDFIRRMRLLHDRWRTSQGQPPVSTPEEKTLLPIPEGLPKPAARGISTKRRKRR